MIERGVADKNEDEAKPSSSGSSGRARRASGAARTAGDGATTAPVKRERPKVGRNDPCPCGSGKKYKKCHGKDEEGGGSMAGGGGDEEGGGGDAIAPRPAPSRAPR